MPDNSLKFGTSGLRGLVSDLQGQAARRYTAAFIKHLSLIGHSTDARVFLGRDFRWSSPSIVSDCAAAIGAAGLQPVDCGALPTPALALHAMAAGCGAIMVTGSHIPDDRNGLKFYLPAGEISKADEASIVAALHDQYVPDWPGVVLDDAVSATERYFARLAGLLPNGALSGLRIGVFEHSSVARDLLTRILRHFGSEIVALNRRDEFVAVDTEALDDAVFASLPGWLALHSLDAIVSADGDGDRPLLMDRHGKFVRGDVLGLLAARYLEAETVATPVTSNSAIERTGYFPSVVRTKVGSPYVVAAMEQGVGAVVGFEANGGTFVGRGVTVAGQVLPPLATRDAILPILAALGLAQAQGQTIDELVAALPLQHSVAGRLQDIPSESSGAFLRRLAIDPNYAEALFRPHEIANVSQIDGLQFRTTSGDMLHFRASGNAPELRCYAEGRTPQIARELLEWGLGVAAREVGRHTFEPALS